MPGEQIQWFPGHMAKTRRLIAENAKNVHLFIEVLDARVPVSSRNPVLPELTGGKPVLLLLNKASLADPDKSRVFMRAYTDADTACLLCDCVTGEGLNRVPDTVRRLLAERVERYEAKGQTGRHLRAMVVGIPNTGKSTLINRLSGAARLKTENRPGVTRDKQWVATRWGLDLLDMPGVLWPRFESPVVGENLALTGAIKDDILDVEHLARVLVRRLRTLYPAAMAARYRLTDWESLTDAELVTAVGKKRGCLVSGGLVDTERVSNLLIDEFRAGRIGRLTIDAVPDCPTPTAAPPEEGAGNA